MERGFDETLFTVNAANTANVNSNFWIPLACFLAAKRDEDFEGAGARGEIKTPFDQRKGKWNEVCEQKSGKVAEQRIQQESVVQPLSCSGALG